MLSWNERPITRNGALSLRRYAPRKPLTPFLQADWPWKLPLNDARTLRPTVPLPPTRSLPGASSGEYPEDDAVNAADLVEDAVEDTAQRVALQVVQLAALPRGLWDHCPTDSTYARTTGETVWRVIPRSRQYAPASHALIVLAPRLELQEPQQMATVDGSSKGGSQLRCSIVAQSPRQPPADGSTMDFWQ